MMPTPSLEKPAAVKKISWNGAYWVCDSFEVRVWRCWSKDKRDLADIDPDDPTSVQLTSDPDWLAVGKPVKKVDTWWVPVGIKQGITVAPSYAPVPSPEAATADPTLSLNMPAPGTDPAATSTLGDAPHFDITDDFNVAPEPPQKVFSVSATVTVKIKIDAPLDQAMAAAGMFPGAMAISAGIAPVTLTAPIRYEVTPPTIQWIASSDRPVLLNGKPSASAARPSAFPDGGAQAIAGSPIRLDDVTRDDVRLVVDKMPPGWNQFLSVQAGIAEKSRKLAVRATALQPAPHAPPGSLEARLHIISEKLVINNVTDIAPAAIPEPQTDIELFVVTRSRSPWLGTVVQRGLLIDALALDTAIYFSNMPLASNQFQPADSMVWDDLHCVAVTPKDLVSNPPDPCLLAVRLDYLAHWDEPPIHWHTKDEFENISYNPTPGHDWVLDDKFESANARQAIYHAPTMDAWTSAEKPDYRTIICLVGPGKDTEEVPDHPGLYFTAPLETELGLIYRLRKVRLKIKLGPTASGQAAGLAGVAGGNVQLDLRNPDIQGALVREFYLDLEFL
jgi:hypothetical protein